MARVVSLSLCRIPCVALGSVSETGHLGDDSQDDSGVLSLALFVREPKSLFWCAVFFGHCVVGSERRRGGDNNPWRHSLIHLLVAFLSVTSRHGRTRHQRHNRVIRRLRAKHKHQHRATRIRAENNNNNNQAVKEGRKEGSGGPPRTTRHGTAQRRAGVVSLTRRERNSIQFNSTQLKASRQTERSEATRHNTAQHIATRKHPERSTRKNTEQKDRRGLAAAVASFAFNQTKPN